MHNEKTVSLIIRSMGRECLAQAIASVASQRHRPIELLVVDATGGRHPPLPSAPGLDEMRLIDAGRPLNRPAAANAGLAAARGEWIGFLDDDDFLEPTHVDRLVARGQEPDRPTLVYAQHWSLDRFHRVVHRHHLGFNPLIMHYYCQIFGMSCLIHRSLRDAGHRLDETLDTSEDWDFWLRLMTVARFATIPEATHFYFLESGTSGTGIGLNRHGRANHAHHHAQVKERYAIERATTWGVYFERLRTGIALHHAGQTHAARSHYEALLREFPGEPNARYLLGRVCADLGELHVACELYRQAIYFNGDAGDYHFALGEACEKLGYAEEAADAYRAAVRYAPALASVVRDKLRATGMHALPEGAAPVAGRNAACPCGSGLRFKACHGKPAAERAIEPAQGLEEARQHALHLAQAGEIRGALDAYSAILKSASGDADALYGRALLAWDMGDFDSARIDIAHAARLRPDDTQVADDYGRIRIAGYERAKRREVAARLSALPCVGTAADAALAVAVGTPVHVIATFEHAAGDEEDPSLALAHALAGKANVTRWTTGADGRPERAQGVRLLDPARGVIPTTGVFVFCGIRQSSTEWLAACRPARVVVVVDDDDAPRLLDLVNALHRATLLPVHLVIPSDAFRRRTGLPGIACTIPRESIRLERAIVRPVGSFTVGRVARNDHRQFHPYDPSLFRRIVAGGFRMRILGGTVLMRHFMPALRHAALDLMPTGAEPLSVFLTTVDCMFHRTSRHEGMQGHTGTILDAFAAGLPVVCARDADEAAMVTHQVDGFLFDAGDDDEALRYLSALRDDPGLHARMGAAARAKAVALDVASRRALCLALWGEDKASDPARREPPGGRQHLIREQT